MKLWRTVCFSLGVVALTCGGATANDDEEEPKAPKLVTAIHWIGGLTHGRAEFAEQPLGIAHRTGDERAYPKFGEREDRLYPWGAADETIELIKSHVAPRFWEDTMGANVASTTEAILVVSATHEIHEEIARYITTLERDAAPVRVDLIAVPMIPALRSNLAAGVAWKDETLRKVSGALTASIQTINGSNATVARGTHHALVVGMSAKHGSGSVPTPDVEVGRYGLRAVVEPRLTPGGEAWIQLDVSISSLSPRSETATPSSLDLREERVVSWDADLNVPLEHWRFVGATGSGDRSEDGWGLFVRIRARDDHQSPAKPLFLPQTKAPSPDASYIPRRYTIADLWTAFHDRFSSQLALQSTNDPSPEPIPDQPRHGLWSPDHLVELIQYTAGGESAWEYGTIQAMNGQLFVRNQPHVLEAIEGILAAVRGQARASIAFDVQVFDVEAHAQPADGAATAVATVRARPGQRNHASSIRRHRYVGTHQVETLDGRTAVEPRRFDVDLGLTVEVYPTLDLSGQGAHLDLRLVQQSLGETATARTPEVGLIELPVVRVHRGQTALRVRFGEPVDVFRTTVDGRERIVRLTARRAR